MRTLVILLALIGIPATLAPAQVRPPRPSRDVGDLRPQEIASAAIGGRVTAAETGAPLRRVEMTATAAATSSPAFHRASGGCRR